MSLEISLRELEHGVQELQGELALDELGLDVQDELVQVLRPLRYRLRAERMGSGVLVQGQLELPLRCSCARCLAEFEWLLRLEGWACHLELEGEDAVPVRQDAVDLTPQVREDILLAFPQHPLCEPECRGLPSAQREDVPKMGPDRPQGSVLVWAELDKLKL